MAFLPRVRIEGRREDFDQQVSAQLAAPAKSARCGYGSSIAPASEKETIPAGSKGLSFLSHLPDPTAKHARSDKAFHFPVRCDDLERAPLPRLGLSLSENWTLKCMCGGFRTLIRWHCVLCSGGGGRAGGEKSFLRCSFYENKDWFYLLQIAQR